MKKFNYYGENLPAYMALVKFMPLLIYKSLT